ncbi:hypothetical protein CQ393_02535 [Stenotrophomonas sp. MYb238]|nr:hypothetical protein [Stenotrophomonas sp. MYb238]
MHNGPTLPRHAASTDAAMACLQRTTYGVVAGGGVLILLCGLLPWAWAAIPAHPLAWTVISVALVAAYMALALLLLLPRLAQVRLLAARDLAELESSRKALETGNRELQAMAGRLFSVQEDERRAISRDLHDDIGQAVTAIKLAAHAAMDEDDTRRRREDLGQIVELVDSTVVRLRNLSMLLRPPQLDALGLEAALRWQAGQLFRSSPVELWMEVDELPQRPDNEVEQACFRIAQESLTNALRHALASQVRLSLEDDGDGRLRLRVVDDGEGFDPDGPRGLGLVVMRERAQSVGGWLRIRTAPGEGTQIELHLPYRAPQAAACQGA